ncbi:MAG: A/G-specific adenine glycosylase [Bacteroidia bacterium]|jgi:A/G-specific adenine glycosylase|nr:A/G-specific adenine glycosylase [Bacteroidia bacterium]
MDFSSELHRWYHQNRRDLPWRHTRDPYLIWLSEVILQQTRVEQGRSYYERFAQTWPDVTALASASEEQVLKLWQGLGYYSRARNLHKTAQLIATQHGGKFPQTYHGLLALKGIGEYTAAAIGSFAFDIAEPVVDGNVYRVLARVFGVDTPIDSTAGKKEFRQLAAELLNRRDPATHNQAIMEFGAVQCLPRNPQCPTCPLAQECVARTTGRIAELPVKARKTKVADRWLHYFVFRIHEHIYVKRRGEGDIWQGLYDFPLIETETAETDPFHTESWEKWSGSSKIKLLNTTDEFLHILSHRRLHARFYEVELRQQFSQAISKDWLKVTPLQFKKLAVPVLITRYLKTPGNIVNNGNH